jgi:transposase
MNDMQSAASSGSPTLAETPSMSAAELAALARSQAHTIAVQDEKIAALEHQIEWFRRQIFGQKSERFAPEPDPSQMHLGETFPVPTVAVDERKPIAAHTRRTAQHDGAESGEELPFFDESKVPVQTITLVHADIEGLASDQYEVIGDLPDRSASGRLSCAEVPAARHQALQREDPRSAGPGRGLGGQPSGCQLRRWVADG